MDNIIKDVFRKREVQRIYELNLSSRLWSAGRLVAFRTVW